MERIFKEEFKKQIHTNKIVLLSGPPKVGKVEMAETCLTELGNSYETIDFKNLQIRRKFALLSDDERRWYFNQHAFFVLGNVQLYAGLEALVEDILTENVSCSVVLCNAFKPQLNAELLEALKYGGLDFYMPAPTFYELTQWNGINREDQRIEHRLIFGNYPQIQHFPENSTEILLQVLDETLDTNLGTDDRINKKEALMRTLQIAAHLIGEAISYNQIAEKIGVDNETVERYLNLLEKAHLLYVIPAWHTVQRYELKKTHFVYFADNGIRNALINNFNPLTMRMDEDALWKNWLIAERIKWNRLSGRENRYFFWKSHTRQQIDFIEEKEGAAVAYRFVLNKTKKLKNPPLFAAYYPKIVFKSINRTGYLTFLTQK